MVKSALQELIEFYELEKAGLEISIKTFLEELEYKMAHYQLRGLKKVNKTLQTLYNLADPLYDTRTRLESEKNVYEKLRNEWKNNAYFDEKIIKIDQLLEALSREKTKQALDGQEFDDALYDVIEGKTKGFRFHLRKSANFWIDFRTANDTTMIISVTPTTQITEDYFLTKSHIHGFTGLGFIFNKAAGTLEYVYHTTSFKNVFFVKILIARIIFDIFYYKVFDHPAFIEYYR
jgi:hypothetical protein